MKEVFFLIRKESQRFFYLYVDVDTLDATLQQECSNYDHIQTILCIERSFDKSKIPRIATDTIVIWIEELPHI